MKKQWTDEEIIQAMRGEDLKRRQQALKQLYLDKKLNKAIKAQFYKYGGTKSNVKDYLHNVIIIFYDKVLSEDFCLTKGGIRPFMTSIAQKHYYSQNRSEKRREERHQKSGYFSWIKNLFSIKEKTFNEDKDLLEQSLSSIGQRCKTILKLASQSYKMKEIQVMLKYKSEASTKMAVSSCRKKLRAFLENHPYIKQSLLEFYKHG